MPPRGTFVIHNARIVTVSGADIENGTVVIRDGKIAAVGTTVDIPANSQTIDAHGLSIYPGMIDAGTSMGLVEVGQGAFGTVDTGEVGISTRTQKLLSRLIRTAHTLPLPEWTASPPLYRCPPAA